MPQHRVLVLQSCTAYSLGPTTRASGGGNDTVNYALPANSCGGTLTVAATSPGNCGGVGVGVIISAVFNGGAPVSTACLTNSNATIPIPAGTTLAAVTWTFGCGGGALATSATVTLGS